MTPLYSFDEVVTALGGVTAVGRMIGQKPSAVTNWRRTRGRFPTRYYFLMKFELEERGFYAPLDLWGFVGQFKQSA